MPNEILYGFAQLADQFGDRVSNVGIEYVSAAIGLTLEKHNQDLNTFLSIFATPTTRHQQVFKSLTSGRLQPLDENGRPRKVKDGPRYTVAYPMRMAGTAGGENFVTAAKMTVGAANDLTAQKLIADMNWVRSQLLAALLANAPYTYADPDDDIGELTIQGLANGDGVLYVYTDGRDVAADNHYVAQNDAISDAHNPFPDIYEDLMEHPENGGDVVSFIPSGLRSSVKGLSNFIEVADPNVAQGADASRIVGTLGVAHPGKLIGYCDQNWIVEWAPLPSGVVISTTTSGDSPLRMRQDEEPELQGLILRGREDSPFEERHWYRRCGFGAHNRVGARVTLIGNSVYAVPSGYAQPLP